MFKIRHRGSSAPATFPLSPFMELVPLTLFVLFVALPIVADISGEISQGVAPLFTPSKVLFAAWLYD
jgi:hypothetical protein